VPEGALIVVKRPNLNTPSIIRFPVFVCSREPTFIGAGRLELNKEIRKQLRHSLSCLFLNIWELNFHIFPRVEGWARKN